MTETPISDADIEELVGTAVLDLDGDLVAVTGPPMRPGDVVETRIVVLSRKQASKLRAKFGKAEARFVDDPRKSVSKAADVVMDAIEALAKALEAQQKELEPRKRTRKADTETLRVALRQYKDFLERILAL